jgi:hypothetical protein
VTLQRHTKKGGFADDGVFWPIELWKDLSYAQKEEIVVSWIKQIRRPDQAAPAGSVATDPVWLHELPALHDYMVCSTNPDGSARRTASLTVFAEHGSFKLWLNDRDSGASLCVSGDTVAGALSSLEAVLEAENPPWRFSDRGRGENGRKGRRGS